MRDHLRRTKPHKPRVLRVPFCRILATKTFTVSIYIYTTSTSMRLTFLQPADVTAQTWESEDDVEPNATGVVTVPPPSQPVVARTFEADVAFIMAATTCNRRAAIDTLQGLESVEEAVMWLLRYGPPGYNRNLGDYR